MGKPLSPAEFQSRLIKSRSGCLEYGRKVNNSGYGSLSYRGKYWLAHRLAWVLANGEIPQGMCVCHTCDNPKCCNPRHLFLGSHTANMGDMKRKGRRLHVNSGTANGRAKLTEQAAAEIRALYSHGVTQVELAKQFGVSQTLVSLVIRGRLWA